ncbi:MAG: DUF3010 family protein [bacterium]
MIICGVDLKGKDANLCLLTLDEGAYTIPDIRTVKLPVRDHNDTGDVRYFQKSFEKLMEDYKVRDIVIAQRLPVGKLQDGAISFKLEGVIQCIDSLRVDILPPTDIKEQLKHTPLPIDFRDTGLKPFQKQAFIAAFVALNRRALKLD